MTCLKNFLASSTIRKLFSEKKKSMDLYGSHKILVSITDAYPTSKHCVMSACNWY